MFWSAYPRKTGKGAARKAWAKATDRPPILAILANIQAHVDSDQWQREGGQFIPHPATWLNQKRWDDEPGPQAGNIPTELERHNAAVAERFIGRGGAAAKRGDPKHNSPTLAGEHCRGRTMSSTWDNGRRAETIKRWGPRARAV